MSPLLSYSPVSTQLAAPTHPLPLLALACSSENTPAPLPSTSVFRASILRELNDNWLASRDVSHGTRSVCKRLFNQDIENDLEVDKTIASIAPNIFMDAQETGFYPVASTLNSLFYVDKARPKKLKNDVRAQVYYESISQDLGAVGLHMPQPYTSSGAPCAPDMLATRMKGKVNCDGWHDRNTRFEDLDMIDCYLLAIVKQELTFSACKGYIRVDNFIPRNVMWSRLLDQPHYCPAPPIMGFPRRNMHQIMQKIRSGLEQNILPKLHLVDLSIPDRTRKLECLPDYVHAWSNGNPHILEYLIAAFPYDVQRHVRDHNKNYRC